MSPDGRNITLHIKYSCQKIELKSDQGCGSNLTGNRDVQSNKIQTLYETTHTNDPVSILFKKLHFYLKIYKYEKYMFYFYALNMYILNICFSYLNYKELNI